MGADFIYSVAPMLGDDPETQRSRYRALATKITKDPRATERIAGWADEACDPYVPDAVNEYVQLQGGPGYFSEFTDEAKPQILLALVELALKEVHENHREVATIALDGSPKHWISGCMSWGDQTDAMEALNVLGATFYWAHATLSATTQEEPCSDASNG